MTHDDDGTDDRAPEQTPDQTLDQAAEQVPEQRRTPDASTAMVTARFSPTRPAPWSMAMPCC